jgi:acyl carrier protein
MKAEDMRDEFKSDIFGQVQACLTEILDLDHHEVSLESYIMRDLGAESIDLLELAVALNSRFKIEINDDEIFLRALRYHLTEANERQEDAAGRLAAEFPFLPESRIAEIMADLDGGPVLKVKDLVSYINWQIGKR